MLTQGATPNSPKPAATNFISLEKAGMALALCSVAGGSLVILGWMNDIEVLKRVSPSSVAMNPTTACCIILSGLAIALHQFSLRRTASTIAAAVAIVASAKIADLILGGVPVDRVLFADLLDSQPGVHPNRMAPNTAVAFLLIGSSLVLAGSKRNILRLVSQALTVPVLLISMFALVGYAFGIDHLRTIGPFIPMALHTALAILVLGIGIASLTKDVGYLVVLRDPGPAGSISRMVLPLTVFTPMAIGGVRLWGERHGYYGTEAGVALMVLANVLVTSALLASSIVALRRSDQLRRRREQALAQSEHFNRIIAEGSPDCVSFLDHEGTVLFANKAAVRAYGLETDAELLGRPWGCRLEATAREARDAALAAAKKGGVGQLTLCLSDRGGELRWFESLVSKVPAAVGQRIHFMVMSRDITRQKQVEDQVRWTASHDTLTRLPNRALFQARLDECAHGGGESNFAILLLDVDDFKQVNDTLGHDAGDALLCIVADRLRQSVRQEDLVARLGGDEFAIILSGVRSEAGATAAADKIFEALREPWFYNGQVADCRVSIGGSIAPTHGKEPSELLKSADIALYCAKAKGSGRIAVFRPGMRADIHKRSTKMSLARKALKDNLIVPFYQPKVDLTSKRLIGFEALLRWRHPTRGVQLPSSIDAAFQDVELARELTDRVLSYALWDIRNWLERGVNFGHVAINAAAADFKQRDFAERLLERLDAYSLPRSCVQLEVTETVFFGRGAEYVERALKTLSASGIRLALDDFGTGYASLSHLKQFPIDIVKIDRSFLRDIQKDAHNEAIIRTILSLGRSLDLEVVAEGVETPEQESYLISQGCQLGQGYLYGKAAPASRIPALIKSWPGSFSQAA